MESIGAYHAKTHLPALLDRVARGERITITRHGVPVAQLVPVTDTVDQERASRAATALKALRKGTTWKGETFRDAMRSGHRF